MKEYKRILLPLQKEKILVIAAVCSGLFCSDFKFISATIHGTNCR